MSPRTPAPTRAILAPLIAGGGIVPRADVESALGGLGSDLRRALTRSGLTIGTLDVYDLRLLKPGALFWANALDAVRMGTPVADALQAGATTGKGRAARGYRLFGDTLVRIDLVERIARATHDMRTAREAFVPDAALATSFGIDGTTHAAILTALGFGPASMGNGHGECVRKSRVLQSRSNPMPLPRWRRYVLVEGAMRLDRFLWFARLSASRSFAHRLVDSGHLRLDGRPISKPATLVRVGQVLTFATHRGDIRVVRVVALPVRRGPPHEARACYTDMIDEADAQI